ncbi:MAG: ArsA-related P-loop ATPase [Terracoccus sp.]
MTSSSTDPRSDVRLHIVTGKGGTGKTTVAAALALALAAHNQRVLLCEVEERQGISQTFDVPPLGTQETRVARTASGGEVVGLSVEPKQALMEYLQLFYKLGRAGRILEKFGAVDFATTIAPGVRDVLLIGRVYEANRRRLDGKHKGQGPAAYDAVVLDAPPTGRIGRFLGVNSEVADLAKVGPIHSQSQSIMRLLTSTQSQVHFVTLLEEMPVQETLEAVAELSEKGLHPGFIVVNMVREPLLDDAALESARAGRLHRSSITNQLVEAGVKATPGLVDGLMTEARDHAHRVDLEREQLELLTASGLPIVTLPALPEGADAGSIRQLADLIAAQGMLG